MRRLITVEVMRLLIRTRLYLLWGLLLASCLYVFFYRYFYFGGDPKNAISEWLDALNPLSIFLPLFVGVATGDSIAEDRNRQYIPYVLTRSVSKEKYLLSKALGMSLVSSLFVAVTCLMILTVAVVMYPITGVETQWSQALFADHPLVAALLVILSLVLASFALTSVSVLSSAWIRQPYLVAAVPLVVYILLMYAVPGRFEWLNPYTYLSFVSPALSVSSIFTYWIGWMLLFYVIAVWQFERLEDLT